MSYMSQKSRLFHVLNLSVLKFQIVYAHASLALVSAVTRRPCEVVAVAAPGYVPELQSSTTAAAAAPHRTAHPCESLCLCVYFGRAAPRHGAGRTLCRRISGALFGSPPARRTTHGPRGRTVTSDRHAASCYSGVGRGYAGAGPGQGRVWWSDSSRDPSAAQRVAG